MLFSTSNPFFSHATSTYTSPTEGCAYCTLQREEWCQRCFHLADCLSPNRLTKTENACFHTSLATGQTPRKEVSDSQSRPRSRALSHCAHVNRKFSPGPQKRHLQEKNSLRLAAGYQYKPVSGLASKAKRKTCLLTVAHALNKVFECFSKLPGLKTDGTLMLRESLDAKKKCF